MERESVPVYTGLLWMPVTDDQLRDAGLLPPPPPRPPDPWPVRMKRAIRLWYWGKRWRLAEMIAGQPLDQDPW